MFDLLSLQSFSNIFPLTVRITLFQALKTAGSACRCQPDPVPASNSKATSPLAAPLVPLATSTHFHRVQGDPWRSTR